MLLFHFVIIALAAGLWQMGGKEGCPGTDDAFMVLLFRLRVFFVWLIPASALAHGQFFRHICRRTSSFPFLLRSVTFSA